MTSDKLLDIIQAFYINKTLTKDEQNMINDLIEVAGNYLKLTRNSNKYKEAMQNIIDSEPQEDEDEIAYLNSIKSYMQGVLDENW